jgi:hypothetical protein
MPSLSTRIRSSDDERAAALRLTGVFGTTGAAASELGVAEKSLAKFIRGDQTNMTTHRAILDGLWRVGYWTQPDSEKYPK